MNIRDIPRAVTLAARLKGANERLAEVHKWGFQTSPCYVTIDRCSVMVNNVDAFDKLKVVIIDLIKTEILEEQDALKALGVDIS